MLARGSIRQIHSSRALRNKSETYGEIDKLLNKLLNIGEEHFASNKPHSKQIIKKSDRAANLITKKKNSFTGLSNEIMGVFDGVENPQAVVKPVTKSFKNKLSSKARRQTAQPHRDSSKKTRTSASFLKSEKKTQPSSNTDKRNNPPAIKSNPNLSAISSKYSPEIPSLDDLLVNSSVRSLSNTADSKIVRLLKELKMNSSLDVNTALKAQSELATLDLSIFKGNGGLKNNAGVVLNALNNNNTIPFATKMQLIRPLTGLDSIKSLP